MSAKRTDAHAVTSIDIQVQRKLRYVEVAGREDAIVKLGREAWQADFQGTKSVGGWVNLTSRVVHICRRDEARALDVDELSWR